MGRESLDCLATLMVIFIIDMELMLKMVIVNCHEQPTMPRPVLSTAVFLTHPVETVNIYFIN